MSNLYRKKPVVIEASQWFKNGDHPLDYANELCGFENGEARIFSAEHCKSQAWEGQLVRYYRTPDLDGQTLCKHCGDIMRNHGWIETLEGGHIACPGDWIITGIKGEHYPCKPDVFDRTYEPAAASTAQPESAKREPYRKLAAEKPEHCMCEACKDGVIHASDCSVHNMPAMPNGPCDCGAEKPEDQFCDGHCTWRDHHPDCVRAEKSEGKAEQKACVGCLHGLAAHEGKHRHPSGIYAGDCTSSETNAASPAQPNAAPELTDDRILQLWSENMPAGFTTNADVVKAARALLAKSAQPEAVQALADMEQRKDASYLERNQVVAALAKCFPSGVARTAIEGWSEDWHGCVYIDLPTGQASWHFHDSQAYLFDGLPPYEGAWDGHDTPEKYRRLTAIPPAQQVEKDAQRYRWLRNPDQDVALVLDKQKEWVHPDDAVPGVGGYWAYEYRAGEELDAAIDAAIAQKEKDQ